MYGTLLYPHLHYYARTDHNLHYRNTVKDLLNFLEVVKDLLNFLEVVTAPHWMMCLYMPWKVDIYLFIIASLYLHYQVFLYTVQDLLAWMTASHLMVFFCVSFFSLEVDSSPFANLLFPFCLYSYL